MYPALTMVYTPADVAELLGISASSVRNWARWHRAHLSTGANPPRGANRIFTETDVQVLQHVVHLRKLGKESEEINEELSGLTFPIVEPESEAEDEPIAESKGTALLPVAPAVKQLSMQLQRLADQQDRLTNLDQRLRTVERAYIMSQVVIWLLAAALIILLIFMAVLWLQ